ncbi:transporter substrate-binding domain-containing protein [Massilia sp. CCM 8695]|uniref:Transporter substrate-binding domain-containing protein n=1 Tax=Massilia frigida TaxID=2609281 RepID=A0ABX0MZJ8_9BURK|nr:transporter substrate-binding domain-containing protein [Massilia frigida]NHZ78222.1 transporter substrate-binding domain-containing protein [Massilia frigida]
MTRSDSPVDAARRALLLGAAAALALPAGAAPRELLVVGAHFARVYERANGEFSGMAVEIIRAIGGELGQPVYFELYPWARAQSMVAQGQADILVGPYKSPERLELFTFSERPFYQDQMVFFSRSSAPFAWDGTFSSLRGKRIVIINGWAYGDEFNAGIKDLAVSVTNSVESALTMLAHGRVDLFASNVRNTEPVIPLLALEGKVVPVGRTISLQRGFFAFPKRPEYDVMRSRFDRAFNAYVDSGELRKLGKRLNVQVP